MFFLQYFSRIYEILIYTIPIPQSWYNRVVTYSVLSARFSATRLATTRLLCTWDNFAVTWKYSLQAPGTSLDEYQERVASMSPVDGPYAALSCQVRDGETSYTFWTLTSLWYNYDITPTRLSRVARRAKAFSTCYADTRAISRDIFAYRGARCTLHVRETHGSYISYIHKSILFR